MKVVVAGGTGLIGSRLIEVLRAAGHDAVVLSRGAASTDGGGRIVHWDAKTASSALAEELRGADAVVNLAGADIGARRWTEGRKQTIVASRVDSTTALVGAIGQLSEDVRPGVLVNSSGIGYAGDSGQEIVDEDVEPGSTFLASVCVEWEAAAGEVATHGVRAAMVRTPVVLARDARALRLMALPFRFFMGGRLGSGDQWFPWIHIDDLVAVILRVIADESLAGPVNAVAPDPRTQRQVAREIARVLHRPSAFPTPAWLLRTALGEQADLMLHGQRAVSNRLEDFAFSYPQLSEALEEALA
jgi:uncharacterized protein (TIGR01777 family)